MDRSQKGSLSPRHDASSRVQKTESAADRLAALRARISGAVDRSKEAKGGLNVGLHPMLQNLGSNDTSAKGIDSKKLQPQSRNDSRRNQHQQKSASPAPPTGDGKSNPYFDEKAAQEAAGRQRPVRPLEINRKGKYIQQGEAIRRQAKLEEMKKRIAAQTKKANVSDDADVEKNFVVEAPPDIEWWDEGLVDGSNYDEIENLAKLKLSGPDSVITEYIQCPAQIEPPQDKQAPAPKAMHLTSKEQAKIRRQRRMAELKEQQAKIRLGLVAAPPPKVKKGNLMRVLGDVAVKDPTAVEAKVNREIADRHKKHVDTNQERKLGKEQRHEKLEKKQQVDADKGIHVLVFKINSLANGQHRFKIGKNADQLALTGTCIMHPKFNLVVVEGGAHSVNKYKKLMLQRIDWTENAPSREQSNQNHVVRDWLVAENEKGELKDMSLNECKLIFEGEQRARGFYKWGSKVCETDSEAREALARANMDSFWQMAKSYA